MGQVQTDIIARLQLKADQFSSESGRAFAEMATRAQAASQNVRQTFGSSFAEVKKLAEQALTLPRTATGSLDLSAEIASLRQAATTADTHAAASRELGAAMLIAAGSARTVTESMRLEADAAMVAARASEADAGAIRQRILALEEVQRELNKTATATGHHARAANDNAVSVQQQRQSTIMLGQQLQDFSVQVVSGQSVTTAFAQQIGQAAFALQGMGGKLAGVATFLGSGWGIAATVGLTVLAPLVSKILEGNDALDDAIDRLKKNANESEATARAQDIFARSAEGVAQAIREQSKALDDSDRSLRTRAEQANIDAKEELGREIAVRRTTLAMIEQARVLAENAKGRSIAAGGPGGAQSLVANQYAAEVERLEKVAAEQERLIRQAEQNVQRSRVDLAAENAKRSTDPIAQLNKLYDDRIALIDKETTAAIRNGAVVGAATQRKIEAIEREREVELKLERDRQAAATRSTAANRQTGREVSSAEASAIVRGIGGQVNSADRTFAQQKRLYDAWVTAGRPRDNPVARPGSSAHERGNGLDVQMTAGMTPAKLREAFQREGVHLTKVFAERGHWHIEWKKSGEAAQALARSVREADQAERELGRSLDQVLGRFDPAAAAAKRYREELAQIDKLAKAGRISGATAETYKARASDTLNAGLLTDLRAKSDRVVSDAIDQANADLDKFLDQGRNAQQQIVDSWMTAGDAFRNAAASLADMLGIRVSGPLRGLLQPGGIEGQAADTAKALTDSLQRAGVKIDDVSMQKLTDKLGTVLGNAAYGQIGGSVFGSITGGKQSKLGSSIGGILGGEAGKALGSTIASSVGGMLGKTLGSAAGPLGAIAGGILGSVVGGLFKKSKTGSATIGNVAGEAGVTGTGGNTASYKQVASGLAGTVNDKLMSIVNALGGSLGTFSVSIGQSGDSYHVDTTGRNRLKKSQGGKDFDDNEAAAIEFAIRDAISDGAIAGISAASQRILRGGGNLEAALNKALMIESIPKDLKAMLDPVGAALDALNTKWKATVAALKEGGATAEQMAQAERLYQLQLDQTKASTNSASQALKDFLAGMKLGSSSPYSLRDQEAAAKVALQPFLDQIAAGGSIDQGKYQSAATAYLDVERQLYGSTAKYFEAMDAVQAATSKAISAIDNVQPITPAVENPFAKATAASAAATASGVQVSNELLAQLSEQLIGVQGALEALGMSGVGGTDFIGADRLFASAA